VDHNTSDGSTVRKFIFTELNNKLDKITVSNTSFNYVYDANGNTISEGSSRHFQWDHSNRMKSFYIQVNNSEPSVYTLYLYDSHGNRIKKVTRKQGGNQIESLVNIDDIFEHYKVINPKTEENNTISINDNGKHIATIRIGNSIMNDRTPAVKFHINDHL